ncbi:hypothetical protein GGI02_002045 [Coemansia sp. RSA 2322]|nr:hypothetical protein GGI02_002045 [Coemansia sp. RSA 2322]
MACLFLASIFWFVGDVQVNGHVTLAGTVLTNCRGFGFWMRILLGMCGVCAVFALRSYALYHVFCLNLPYYRGPGFFIPIVVYAICIVVYGIVVLVLKGTSTLYYLPQLDICSSSVPFKASVFAFIWATLLFVAIIYWRIRNIKSSFNESREMAAACFLILVTMLFATLVQFLHPQFPLSKPYRIASTILSHSCTNAIWWGVMAVPLFNCLVRRKAYLDLWISKLRSDGMQREYHVNSSIGMQPIADIVDPAENIRRGPSFAYKFSDHQGFFYSNHNDISLDTTEPNYVDNGRDMRAVKVDASSTLSWPASVEECTEDCKYVASNMHPRHLV